MKERNFQRVRDPEIRSHRVKGHPDQTVLIPPQPDPKLVREIYEGRLRQHLSSPKSPSLLAYPFPEDRDDTPVMRLGGEPVTVNDHQPARSLYKPPTDEAVEEALKRGRERNKNAQVFRRQQRKPLPELYPRITTTT